MGEGTPTEAKVRGKGYAPNSAICKALRTPHSDEEKKKLYIAAFVSPQLYKWIINEWNGKKITFDGLQIGLIRDREFSDAGAKLAAQIFIENAKFLGLIDAEDNFNIDAEIKIDVNTIKEKRVKSSANKKVNTDKDKTKTEEKHKPYNPNPSGSLGTMKKISVFVRGQELHLLLPEDMNQSDWDVLIKQFQNIKSFAK